MPEVNRYQPLALEGLDDKLIGYEKRRHMHPEALHLLPEGGGWLMAQFGGDTAETDKFKGVRTSKPIDLAIMPIGAYDPWIRFHCNPEQALKMANDAGAERILPVHHQTFQLGREPRYEPIERLLEAAGSDNQRVCLHDIGQEFHL